MHGRELLFVEVVDVIGNVVAVEPAHCIAVAVAGDLVDAFGEVVDEAGGARY